MYHECLARKLANVLVKGRGTSFERKCTNVKRFHKHFAWHTRNTILGVQNVKKIICKIFLIAQVDKKMRVEAVQNTVMRGSIPSLFSLDISTREHDMCTFAP